jgi:hypothetical protein
MSETFNKKAEFSEDRIYRYTLWRSWSPLTAQDGRYINFICLNPSTADETKDDPTIRKCVKFAKAWGYQTMCVTNLFAYRATDPRQMKAANNPIGANNDFYLVRIARAADMVVAAWGAHGSYLARSQDVLKMLDYPVHFLRMGKHEPWHPLYLPDVTKPELWQSLIA